MTKRILILLPILIILFVLIYFNLPTEITRKSDIEFGNTIVENIKKYQKLNNTLPESDNWETLAQFGFINKMLGTNPAYEKINDNEFELIYLEGFDGPYLLYNSKSMEWKVDFPKIPKRLKEKQKTRHNNVYN